MVSLSIWTADESTDVIPFISNTTCLIGPLERSAAGWLFTDPHSSKRRSRAFMSLALVNVSGSGIFTIKHPSLSSRLSLDPAERTPDVCSAAAVCERSAFTSVAVPATWERNWIRDLVECLITRITEYEHPSATPTSIDTNSDAASVTTNVTSSLYPLVRIWNNMSLGVSWTSESPTVPMTAFRTQIGRWYTYGSMYAVTRSVVRPIMNPETGVLAPLIELSLDRASLLDETGISRLEPRLFPAEELSKKPRIAHTNEVENTFGYHCLASPANGSVNLKSSTSTLPRTRTPCLSKRKCADKIVESTTTTRISGKNVDSLNFRRASAFFTELAASSTTNAPSPTTSGEQNGVDAEDGDGGVEDHGEADCGDEALEQRSAEHVVDEAEAEQPEREQHCARGRGDHGEHVDWVHAVVVLDDLLDRLPHNHGHCGLRPHNHLRNGSEQCVHHGRDRKPQQPADGRDVGHRARKRHAERDLYGSFWAMVRLCVLREWATWRVLPSEDVSDDLDTPDELRGSMSGSLMAPNEGGWTAGVLPCKTARLTDPSRRSFSLDDAMCSEYEAK
ncbi:hypothetical protein OGAPHI_003680 [Ogataea philodendri]|uniref:Uncharacterized protein n=1 Tax=Ogataea philodendri TaxID=1378263 RepID=A0A9P8T4Q6_9ASCO|nr:uncharacterized protein OGAPHI_003680 [Ogataea philodendri]KAH3665494.1 hypothetical protein OGAPHI_003680 [Ogataea philodendri]